MLKSTLLHSHSCPHCNHTFFLFHRYLPGAACKLHLSLWSELEQSYQSLLTLTAGIPFSSLSAAHSAEQGAPSCHSSIVWIRPCKRSPPPEAEEPSPALALAPTSCSCRCEMCHCRQLPRPTPGDGDIILLTSLRSQLKSPKHVPPITSHRFGAASADRKAEHMSSQHFQSMGAPAHREHLKTPWETQCPMLWAGRMHPQRQSICHLCPLPSRDQAIPA